MQRAGRIKNSEVAGILYEIADILQIKGAPFKPRAYRRAAQAIETLPEDIAAVCERGQLDEIPGVGKSIAEKIGEILKFGRLAYLETLRKELPAGVEELTKVEGLGPKRALLLNKKLKIRTLDELEAAARGGRIRELPGFGKKSEESILLALERAKKVGHRYLLGYILPIAQDIQRRMEESGTVSFISLTGSIRRRKETIGDVDILAVSPAPERAMEAFLGISGIAQVLARGTTKSSIVLTNGLHVDLRVVGRESYGAALQYFTGSKEHNIRLRELAIERDWKLSEYGLIERSTGAVIAAEREEDVYRALGLAYIEPELREDRGEIDAAREGRLPDLVGYGDMKGDLHVHTTWSEGNNTIEEMAESARSLGYEYIAICDHTKALPVAHGLNEEEIRKQMQEIERLNRTLEGFTILPGIEGNIDRAGRLDIDATVLKDLDVVVASVHSGFKQSEAEMTERVLAAMHSEHVDIIGHPTGRLIHQREPYQIDLARIFAAASDLGTFLEINAFPRRLDLSDVNCQRAREQGVRFSIGSDAHNRSNLRYMEFGVATARRGWLEKKDIVNTLPLQDLRALLG